jgi:mono/diheme cytochrome c family protein
MSVAGTRGRSPGGRIALTLAIVVGVLLLVAVGSWLWYRANPVTPVDAPPGVLAVLTRPIPDGPDAGLLRRGRYLATAGDCVSCHTRAGGLPFTGGRGLATPFGVIYSPNLSGTAAGIAGWTPDQFFRAMHDGVDNDGGHLYPAFPYTHFTIVSRADSDAILAWLKTVPGDASAPPANRLPFPLDLRAVMLVWNAINFAPHGLAANPAQPAAWNRGAYLVQGLGHCGACHTPRTALGADDTAHAFAGGKLDGWIAPDLTGNPRTGLGRWSQQDIVDYLKDGRSARSNAAGPMAEVVTYSTSMLSDADLAAIATYLKGIAASPDGPVTAAPAVAMRTGGAIFGDACTACHREGGVGSPRLFPPLAGSAAVQQADPTSVIRLILAGGRTGPTLARPSALAMPSFAWKLDDQQVADVATYTRNSWGNRAPAVTAGAVADLRAKLHLTAAMPR